MGCEVILQPGTETPEKEASSDPKHPITAEVGVSAASLGQTKVRAPFAGEHPGMESTLWIGMLGWASPAPIRLTLPKCSTKRRWLSSHSTNGESIPGSSRWCREAESLKPHVPFATHGCPQFEMLDLTIWRRLDRIGFATQKTAAASATKTQS